MAAEQAKDEACVTPDTPVMLEDGGATPAAELRPDMPLHFGTMKLPATLIEKFRPADPRYVGVSFTMGERGLTGELVPVADPEQMPPPASEYVLCSCGVYEFDGANHGPGRPMRALALTGDFHAPEGCLDKTGHPLPPRARVKIETDERGVETRSLPCFCGSATFRAADYPGGRETMGTFGGFGPTYRAHTPLRCFGASGVPLVPNVPCSCRARTVPSGLELTMLEIAVATDRHTAALCIDATGRIHRHATPEPS